MNLTTCSVRLLRKVTFVAFVFLPFFLLAICPFLQSSAAEPELPARKPRLNVAVIEPVRLDTFDLAQMIGTLYKIERITDHNANEERRLLQGRTGLDLPIKFETESRVMSLFNWRGYGDAARNLIGAIHPIDGIVLRIGAEQDIVAPTDSLLQMARRFGVPSVVVFVNDSGLPEQTGRELIEAEVCELLRKYQYICDSSTVVEGRATATVAGQSDGKAAIGNLIKAIEACIQPGPEAAEKPFLMLIDKVFVDEGGGTVVAGTVKRGELNKDDAVEIVRGKESLASRALKMATPPRPREKVSAGERAEVFLREVSKEEVQPGMILAKPGSIRSHTRFAAEIYVLSGKEGGRHIPFFNNFRVHVNFELGSAEGAIELPTGIEMAMPGDNVSVEIQLVAPVVLEKGQRFELQKDGKIMGFGRVVEAD